jgi:hypothetical protein
MSFVSLITWFIRYGHVLGAGAWVGGYAVLALVIIPALKKGTNSKLMPIATTTLRLLTYSGVATILFGLVLITRTRGFPSLISGGEWGGIVVVCILIAVALMGINDGALRPALKHLAETGDSRRASRLAWAGFILTILAIGLMTRALYAGS